MAGQFSLSSCSQSYSSNVSLAPAMIWSCKDSLWPSYSTSTTIDPMTSRDSPVCVFTQTLAYCILGTLPFQVSLKVLSLMTEIDAPVSTSITTSAWSNITVTWIGASLSADIWKRAYDVSSCLSSAVSWCEHWTEPWECFLPPRFLLWALAMWLVLPLAWHTAALKGQSLVRCSVPLQR